MLPGSSNCVGSVSPHWVKGRSSILRVGILPVLGCCSVFLASCSGEPTETERIPTVQLLEHEVTIDVGDSLQLHLLPMLPPGYVPPVTWSSESPETASVESIDAHVGLVRGLFPGQAVIRVSGEGASDSAMVVVSPTEPPPSVTLLVSNATCSSGQCTSLQIRGFPIPLNRPKVPGGWSEDLGAVSTASTCLIMHAADSFMVIASGSTTADTALYIWTSYDSLALGVLEPGELPQGKIPSTRAFVPARSAGWRVTLPGDTVVIPADPCG
jgi:hypothetical protein